MKIQIIINTSVLLNNPNTNLIVLQYKLYGLLFNI